MWGPIDFKAAPRTASPSASTYAGSCESRASSLDSTSSRAHRSRSASPGTNFGRIRTDVAGTYCDAHTMIFNAESPVVPNSAAPQSLSMSSAPRFRSHAARICSFTVDAERNEQGKARAFSDECVYTLPEVAYGAHGLAHMIAPGDVLFVRGTGGLALIGTTRGLMGHMLVVLEAPCRVPNGSAEALDLESVWPRGLTEAWRVRTLESCRQENGLHQTDLLLRIDSKTGRLALIGEVNSRGELGSTDEPVEVWQSPQHLRTGFRPDLMAEVLHDMQKCSADWSFATAARAIFLSAKAFSATRGAALMDEIKACWTADPICTSIVIVFWQRYLCKLARITTQHPAELIFGCMPLKADRGLPGDVIAAMRECGWVRVTRVPRMRNITCLAENVADAGIVEVCSGDFTPAAGASARCEDCGPFFC